MPSFQKSTTTALALGVLSFALFCGLSASPVRAQSEALPSPQAELSQFFEATGGPEWVNNQGWLDPETPFCDWHGISCDDVSGENILTGLWLPNNNLTGSLGELALFGGALDLVHVDLSGNQLSGVLAALPSVSGSLNLARNRFDGPLPLAMAVPPSGEIILSTIVPLPLSFLNLSGNDFRGPVPADWGQAFDFSYLNLANNALDADIENAFFAMGHSSFGELVLTDNDFSSSLSDAILDTSLALTDSPRSGGGLNLCWNDLQIDDPSVIEFIDRHHVAGPGWQGCQNRQRVAIDPTVSGSWFSPARSGEGVSLMMLDTGAPLLYGFTYNTQGDQQWYFELGHSGEKFMNWPTLLETRGDFGLGLRIADDDPALRDVARLRMDRLGDGVMQFERVFIDYSDCPIFDGTPPEGDLVPLPCPIFPISDRSTQIQLSRLAGTTCENQRDKQWISGAWFSSERAGEGFLVEVIEDGRGVVYWFTYSADGSGQQLWLTADAHFDGTTLQIDTLYRPTGARYGDGFDRDAIVLEDWGSLELEFSGQDSGRARFSAREERFGEGEFTITRLARPMLAECED